MANTAQARKRVRQAEKARQRNASQRSLMRTRVKNVVKAIASGDQSSAQEAYVLAVPALDQAARKGLIHKNKAARYKSRLNDHIRSMAS